MDALLPFVPPEFRAAVSAIIVAILFTLLTSLTSRPWKSGQSGGWVALGIAISFLICIRLSVGGDLQVFPPTEGWRWIFWVGVIASWGALCDQIVGGSRNARLTLWIPLSILAMVLLVPRRMWKDLSQPAVWIVASVLFSLTVAWLTDRINQKVSSRAILFGWGMTMGAGSSFLVLIGSFQNYSNLATVLGASAGVLFLISMLFKNYRPGFSVWMVLSLLFVVAVVGTTEPWHASLPIGTAVLMLLPLLAPIAAIPFAKNWWLSLLIIIVVTSAFLIYPGIEAYHQYMELREQGFAP